MQCSAYYNVVQFRTVQCSALNWTVVQLNGVNLSRETDTSPAPGYGIIIAEALLKQWWSNGEEGGSIYDEAGGSIYDEEDVLYSGEAGGPIYGEAGGSMSGEEGGSIYF